MIKPLPEIAEWFGASPPLLPVLLAAAFTALVLAVQAIAGLFEGRNS